MYWCKISLRSGALHTSVYEGAKQAGDAKGFTLIPVRYYFYGPTWAFQPIADVLRPQSRKAAESAVRFFE